MLYRSRKKPLTIILNYLIASNSEIAIFNKTITGL